VRRFLLITVSVLVCASAAGSGAIRASTSAAPSWKIVALGDSDTTGQGDPTRVGWVGRYAAQLRQKLGLTVTVVNLAQEGMTSGQLLASVRSDSSTRSALKGAQIVLLGIGALTWMTATPGSRAESASQKRATRQSCRHLAATSTQLRPRFDR